jgi:hypothetical protein
MNEYNHRTELFGFADKIDCSYFLAYVCYCVSYPYTSLDTPLGLQEVEAPRISRQTVHEGGTIVSCTQLPPLPPEDTPGTHFC